MGLGYGREIRSGTLGRSIKTGALSPGCQNKKIDQDQKMPCRNYQEKMINGSRGKSVYA